jgi:CBS domain-containing protein
MNTRVCDLMDREVITCNVDDNLKHVLNLMKMNRFRTVVVQDETGEVWGLISRLAMIRFYGEDLEQIRAEQAMRTYKFDVDPQMPIEKAIEIMKHTKFEHLIIVDPHAGPKRPIGVLASFNIVWYMSMIERGHYEQILKMPREQGVDKTK